MPDSASPRKHALLIGIDHYPNLVHYAPLKGCVNDAHLLARVLEDRYGFPPANVRLLLEEEATRSGIRAAMKELVARTGQDDVVVFGFAGHGSWRNRPQRDQPNAHAECLVPHDSGRNPLPNLDITDDEIHAWLLRLSVQTRYVTLILDSCFSESALRSDSFGDPVRWVEPDERPLPAWRSEEGQETFRGTDGERWIPSRERCVLLAACRSDEHARELAVPESPGTFHGALTFHLCQELLRAGPGSTYLDVFERVAPQITARYSDQHAQLAGARHRELFGMREMAPMSFLPVRERWNGCVVLGGGAAHGLTRGSEWTIYASGTRSTGDEVPRLGLVRVTDIESVTARAEIVEEEGTHPIAAGSRAVETKHCYPELRLAVEIAVPAAEARREPDLRQALESSPLLRYATLGQGNGVCAYLLLPRASAGPGDPVPELETITEPTWAVVGKDGKLQMPPIAADGTEAVQRLVEKLAAWARYRHVLGIENSRLNSLRKGLKVVLKRRGWLGNWVDAEPDKTGEIVFEAGEKFVLAVTNGSVKELYIYVLDLGLTGRVSLIFPEPGADNALAPNRTLEIGARWDEPKELFLPEGFPFAGRPETGAVVQGFEHLKVFATTEQADFSALEQEGFRGEGCERPADDPLTWLFERAWAGAALRDVRSVPPAEDWTVETKRFILRGQV